MGPILKVKAGLVTKGPLCWPETS